MAPDTNPRVAKAFVAMKSLGIDIETTKPVLKHLLKLYNRNWELIEEDNYRTLADAIFEEQDEKLKTEKNGNMIDEDKEPPPKRQHRRNTKDELFSKGDRGKGAADQDDDVVPKSPSRTSMTELPQSDSVDPTTKPHHWGSESLSGSKRHGYPTTKFHHCVSESPSGSKRKDYPTMKLHHCVSESPSVGKRKGSIQINSASNERNMSAQPSSGAHNANHEIDDPDSLDHGNRNVLVPSENQSIDPCGQVIPLCNSYGKRVFHKVNDITKGTEKVKISLLDELGNEALPQYVYCPRNITYESAYVHVSLARISDEDCCADCMGTVFHPPYHVLVLVTQEGSLRLPSGEGQKCSQAWKMQGHILRKFIKECWIKCGCNMLCGNRIVQRGITRNLQVFLTGEGKGWGLRTLEDLPAGAFICEYVGEILTNIELYKRNQKSSGKDKHVYPVLLDSDWATEGTLKDEDALCLDATYYGNVARFINHRCYDGNLIEVPVQIETPDRHYYHLAFFTSRKVNAFEELTWDYEIDFDDNKHPIKAFQCHCGSSYCRDEQGRR